MNQPPRQPRRAAARRRPPRRQQGVVLVIALLAIVLLTCLLVYVINAGSQTRKRLHAQHAADAAAINGAAWVARSLNTVAMNNVAISRYLGLVNVIDALPIATTNALNEARAIAFGVDRAFTFSTTGSGALDDLARNELNLLRAEIAEESQQLDTLSQALQGIDVEGLTHFVAPSAPDGRGRFWSAMAALDELSQASIESLGEVARAAAADGAANLASPTDRALLLPAAPSVPFLRGSFADFRRPVLQGLLPEAIDDKQANRGPYDAVYGWRIPRRIWVPDPVNAPTPAAAPAAGQAFALSPLGGQPDPSTEPPPIPPSPGGHWVTVGYTNYGSHDWTLNFIHDRTQQWSRPNLRFSRFYGWLAAMANTKRDYGWAGLDARFFAQVNWDTQYPTAAEVSSIAEPLPFSETLLVRLEIRSLVPLDDPTFLTPGTFAVENRDNLPNSSHFRIHRVAPWWLPNIGNPAHRMHLPTEFTPPTGSVLQSVGAGSLGWVSSEPRTTLQDYELGLHPQNSATGQPVLHQFHFVEVAFYVGVNRNRVRPGVVVTPQSDLDVLISNPYGGLDPALAPAPTDLNHALLGRTAAPENSAARRQYLTFLGLARAFNAPALLPGRFAARRPEQQIVTLAQAKVFNDHSWDLWTQMWHAQLTPVSDYAGWIDNLDQASAASADPELADLRDYLRSLDQLAPLMLRH